VTFSDKLLNLVGRSALRALNKPIALSVLAQRLFDTEGLTVPTWLRLQELPDVPARELLQHLHGVAENDSKVQDITTTGHLAKLIVRWDVWLKSQNYELLGMPNRKIDELSERDRIEFLKKSTSLNRLTRKGELPLARDTLSREKRWS